VQLHKLNIIRSLVFFYFVRYGFMQATKRSLFSAGHYTYKQPNNDSLHLHSLSYGSEPGSQMRARHQRTKRALVKNPNRTRNKCVLAPWEEKKGSWESMATAGQGYWLQSVMPWYETGVITNSKQIVSSICFFNVILACTKSNITIFIHAKKFL